MRLTSLAAFTLSSAIIAAAPRSVVAPAPRLAVCAVMSDDSLSWQVAERASSALAAHVGADKATIVRASDIQKHLQSSRYGWEANTVDVRELMKMLRVDALIDIQAVRQGQRVVLSALRFETAQAVGYRQPMIAAASVGVAVDSPGARLVKDSLGSRLR
jgi:hypothetical protein